MSHEEFMAKYGHIKVKFKYYYKYRFSFEGLCDNEDIVIVYVGGNTEDIYKLEVSSDEISINSLWPDSGSIYRGKDKIESFSL